MGSMSASDAAPLPRLGEVFFCVRGSSRSMRLSWYADTGVSVFSIWQGGTCTGTFRLPMEELPRLVDALQRGMQGADQQDPRGNAGYLNQLPGAPTDPRLTAIPGGYAGRDTAFSGPVTGDFRAIRSEAPGVFTPVSPRALPPGPAALPAPPQQSTHDYLEDYSAQYPEQQYPEQQYPEQQYPEQQYPQQQYPEQQYPEQQYPEQQ